MRCPNKGLFFKKTEPRYTKEVRVTKQSFVKNKLVLAIKREYVVSLICAVGSPLRSPTTFYPTYVCVCVREYECVCRTGVGGIRHSPVNTLYIIVYFVTLLNFVPRYLSYLKT